MNVGEIMTENPACCTRTMGLEDVAKLMVEHDCGCIPVVDDEGSKMPVGMITDRDITCRIVAKGRNPLDLTAGDAMSSTVVSVTPETSVDDCCVLMEESKLRRIAVVDENGKCCGIVAQADIAMTAQPEDVAEVVEGVSQSAAR